MPFNLQTFKTRALTAVIFVVVMGLGLFWNQWSFWILFLIIHFGCWFEFVKLLKKIYPESYIIRSISGLAYISLPVFLMIWMYTYSSRVTDPEQSIYPMKWLIPVTIIFSIWINDTMAYIVGSFIGKTPFSKISPKKTWEGTVGGALLCVVVISLLAYVTTYLPIAYAAIIAGLAAVFGTLGDLFESKLKRMAGVKDSGSFMPGHGGFLDRFDSLLFAVPAVWLFWAIAIQ